MTSDLPIIEVLGRQDLTPVGEKVKSDLPEYWTREQVHDILDGIRDPGHKMLFTYLWMTGNRVSEALGVRFRDLDFPSHMITIRWLKNRKYETRNIPMHPQLRQLLMLYASNMRADDFIFDMTRQRAWQLCKKYAGANPHKFRHSFAVNWLKCKGNIVILSKILGHSDVKVTMEYLRIVPVEQGEELIKVQF